MAINNSLFRKCPFFLLAYLISISHYKHLCKRSCLLCFVWLQWRYNERDGVSNHRPLDCLLNRLFRCRSKKTSKLRVTGLSEGNPPVTMCAYFCYKVMYCGIFVWCIVGFARRVYSLPQLLSCSICQYAIKYTWFGVLSWFFFVCWFWGYFLATSIRVALKDVGKSINAKTQQRNYSDVIMSPMASQITSIPTVCSVVCWGAYKKNIKAPCHMSLVASPNHRQYDCLFKKSLNLTLAETSIIRSTGGPLWGVIHQWPVDSRHKGPASCLRKTSCGHNEYCRCWGYMCYNTYLQYLSKLLHSFSLL